MRISDQELNRFRILKTVQRAEPIARTELTKLTGLGGATITEVTADLVHRGILIDETVATGSRGRPRRHLRINPEAAYVVGAFLFADGSLAVQIVNMRGQALFEKTSQVPGAATIEALVSNIADLIEATIGESGIARADINRVGVALPAMIDSIDGVIHWLQTFPVTPTSVAAVIERRLGLPVAIENTSNVHARAEHWFSEHAALDTFTLFINGLGIGSARYVDGLLRTGVNGFNSEVGHIKVVFKNGRPCACGARGCLEGYASIAGVVGRSCEAKGISWPRFQEMPAALEAFAAQARAGDQALMDIFQEAGWILGTVVANHVNEFDPGHVLVLNLNQTLCEMTTKSFLAALDENILAPLRARTLIEFTTGREDWFRKGAAALALEQCYLRGDTKAGRRKSSALKTPPP